MRIGIDCQVLRQGRATGTANYIRNLTEALRKLKTEHQFVFLDQSGRIPFWSTHVAYDREIKKANLDILHGPANSVPLFWNMGDWGDKGNRDHARTVITIHDLAIYKHPEWFPGGQWFATKIVVPRSIKKADRIIVPSEATKRDLMELFRVPEEKIAVIPHGVETRFFTTSIDKYREANINESRPADSNSLKLVDTGRNLLQKKYILFVGTLEPRKNLQRVIEAYEGLPEEIKNEYELWVAGGKGWSGREAVGDYQGERGDKGNEGVKYFDYVSYDDLPAIYQNAVLFVYPSLYEGFGLPVLEAMAAGVPVVTSRGSAMEEIIHNPSQPPLSLRGRVPPLKVRGGEGELLPAIFVNPYSTEEITAAMVKILTSPRLARQMSEEGIDLARRFTWEETAKKTLQVLTEA